MINLFKTQLGSSDSVLQIINRHALRLLGDFLTNPTLKRKLDLLCCIPSLHRVLEYEWKKYPIWLESTLGVCRWIKERTEHVLKGLIKYDAPPSLENIQDADGGWQKVLFFTCQVIHSILMIFDRVVVSIVCHKSVIDLNILA